MTNPVLYESPYLKIFKNGPWSRSRSGDVLVVCFQYKLADPHLDQPGFAQAFFEKFQIDAVFVNCATNEWYQYPDLPTALLVLRRFSSAWKTTITYGSSMGAYAALRFAAAIGARSSIAVGPQYSPRSAIVPGEDRFDAIVSQTEFLHENAYRASGDVDNHVIYDPLLKIDARHVLEYRREVNLISIPIPCGGHTPTILLAECGILSEFILHLIEGTFCARRFRTAFRQRRKCSPEYWNEVVERLLERGRGETAKRIAALSPFGKERGTPMVSN